MSIVMFILELAVTAALMPFMWLYEVIRIWS